MVVSIGGLAALACTRASMYRPTDVAMSFLDASEQADSISAVMLGSSEAYRSASGSWRRNHFAGCDANSRGQYLCVFEQETGYSLGHRGPYSLIMVVDRRPDGRLFVGNAWVSPPSLSVGQMMAAASTPPIADSALIRSYALARRGAPEGALAELHAAMKSGAFPETVAAVATDEGRASFGLGFACDSCDSAIWSTTGPVIDTRENLADQFPMPNLEQFWISNDASRGKRAGPDHLTANMDSIRVGLRYLAIARPQLGADDPLLRPTALMLSVIGWYEVAQATASEADRTQNCAVWSIALANYDSAIAEVRALGVTAERWRDAPSNSPVGTILDSLPIEREHVLIASDQFCRQPGDSVKRGQGQL